MPDNKSLQQQAEEIYPDRANPELFTDDQNKSWNQRQREKRDAYLACATKYISEIEARDKRIASLQQCLRDLRISLVEDGYAQSSEEIIEIDKILSNE